MSRHGPSAISNGIAQQYNSVLLMGLNQEMVVDPITNCQQQYDQRGQSDNSHPTIHPVIPPIKTSCCQWIVTVPPDLT